MSSDTAKFADDAKLSRLVMTRENCEEVQRALNMLGEWATLRQMKFSVITSKVMHVGRKNLSYLCTLWRSKWSLQERNLGIIVDIPMKTSAQCAAVVRENLQGVRMHKECNGE